MKNEQVIPAGEKRAEVSVSRGDRKYQLLLPPDASIGEAYEAAFAILLQIIEVAKESAEKMRPKVVEDAQVESVEK
jgi:hypothetical protein